MSEPPPLYCRGRRFEDPKLKHVRFCNGVQEFHFFVFGVGFPESSRSSLERQSPVRLMAFAEGHLQQQLSGETVR